LKFIRLLGLASQDSLSDDREFVGEKWIKYLAGSKVKDKDGKPELQIIISFHTIYN